MLAQPTAIAIALIPERWQVEARNISAGQADRGFINMKRLYQTAASAIFATVVTFGILGVEPAAQAEDSQLPPPLQLLEPTGSYPVGTDTSSAAGFAT